ncbi:hypothetical protein E1B28_006939 [Marasmius oreades]|uniref:Phosphatidate phosphatase APP1 catalytic domain-containing protein n=1 Tax=Marasmius oreades TaxID=181124 RepID=A0A9P7UUF0_9AGAR|nr:uncharacterized protein E1B28_006939 [Marasmius oreades]KAG7093256.1 hypothetical protein E1B28_006939 [Marasmius oreades]
MKFYIAILCLALPFVVDAVPVTEQGLFSAINDFDDVLLFDSPAFQDPENPGNTLINVQSYVFLKHFDLDPLTTVINDALAELGIDVGGQIDRVIDRMKLLATVGLPGREVKMTVEGCEKKATLPKTGFKDLGVVTGIVSVGHCGYGKQFNATVEGNDFAPRATIFPSPPDGFGVISDIDDTIKVSNVLDKLKLVESTLLDDPTPVAGMPELYNSLAISMNQPQFIYISGSPFQLYPFLRDFVDTTYPQGPLFLRNFTLTDLGLLMEWFSEDPSAKLEYKLTQIARVNAMYPQKSFLSIGDSTEEDPEIYAAAFKAHGGEFIRCIWIHLVDDADNSDERFEAAFDGVPWERIRLFDNSQIAALVDIDVAGGKC